MDPHRPTPNAIVCQFPFAVPHFEIRRPVACMLLLIQRTQKTGKLIADQQEAIGIFCQQFAELWIVESLTS